MLLGLFVLSADAYRESYLGHSQFAPVGRWQKGKDILWYTKKHGESKEHITTQTVNPGELARRAEIAAIKAQEEELLNQVLKESLSRQLVSHGCC